MFTVGPAMRKTTIATAVVDQFFQNTKLLIIPNGANGSTSFSDSSLIANTITANGQVNVQSGYAQFDGGSDYLSIPNSSNWQLGANDFTFEATIDAYSLTGGEKPIFGLWSTGGQLSYLSTIDASHRLTFYYSLDGSSGSFSAFSSTSVSTTGGPKHLAITRANGVLRIFIEGVKYYEGTLTSSLFASTSAFTIGGVTYASDSVNARLKNIRFTKYVARYVDTYTVPTTYGTTAPTVLTRFYENDSSTLSNSNRTITFTEPGSNFLAGQLSDFTGANTTTSTTKTGKEYIEFTIGGSSKGTFIGIFENSQALSGFPGNATNPFGTTGCYMMLNIGYNGVQIGLITNGTNTSNSAYDYNIGDTIGMAVDWDAKKIWFKKTPTAWISGDPVAGTSPTFTFSTADSSIYVGSYARNGFTYTVTIDTEFKYTPPTGYGRTIHAGSTAS